jgi:hypothetical protein
VRLLSICLFLALAPHQAVADEIWQLYGGPARPRTDVAWIMLSEGLTVESLDDQVPTRKGWPISMMSFLPAGTMLEVLPGRHELEISLRHTEVTGDGRIEIETSGGGSYRIVVPELEAVLERLRTGKGPVGFASIAVESNAEFPAPTERLEPPCWSTPVRGSISQVDLRELRFRVITESGEQDIFSGKRRADTVVYRRHGGGGGLTMGIGLRAIKVGDRITAYRSSCRPEIVYRILIED